MRLAMGAGRARLVRQLLAETLMLFSLGGVAGLAMARALTSLLVSLLPALPFPVDVSLALDVRAVLFSAGLVLAAALLSGLAPALQASKADVVSALKDDAQAPARLRLRHAFVIAQVAFSILLVVVAGLFVRALQRPARSIPASIRTASSSRRSICRWPATPTRPDRVSPASWSIASVRCRTCRLRPSRWFCRAASRPSAEASDGSRRGPAERPALFRRGLERRRARLLRDAAHPARRRARLYGPRPRGHTASRHRRRRDRAAVLAGTGSRRQVRGPTGTRAERADPERSEDAAGRRRRARREGQQPHRRPVALARVRAAAAAVHAGDHDRRARRPAASASPTRSGRWWRR